jgi:hypothetical protein
MNWKKTKEQMAILYNNQLNNWRKIQHSFKLNWEKIKNSDKVEIHINSISRDDMKRVTMEKFAVKQNLQITRLFEVRNVTTTVI